MRQKYHVWKDHLWKYDYVGFEHCRRLFSLDALAGAEIAAHYPLLMRLVRPDVAMP